MHTQTDTEKHAHKLTQVVWDWLPVALFMSGCKTRAVKDQQRMRQRSV